MPDTIEEIRVSQFYSCSISKLPKSLKVFNVVHKTKITLGTMYDGARIEECVTFTNEPHDNYYQMYGELEQRFPNVQFFY